MTENERQVRVRQKLMQLGPFSHVQAAEVAALLEEEFGDGPAAPPPTTLPGSRAPEAWVAPQRQSAEDGRAAARRRFGDQSSPFEQGASR